MAAYSRQLRMLALQQKGYISSETLRRLDNPGELLIISAWKSFYDWQNGFGSRARKELQSGIDIRLGRETAYKIYPNGFAAEPPQAGGALAEAGQEYRRYRPAAATIFRRPHDSALSDISPRGHF